MLHFTGCSHFGHANIIKYCNRPFANVGEMDQQQIVNWNRVVGTGDDVYHLADFCLGEDAARYFSQLNGNIHILNLPWHHDRRWLEEIANGRRFLTTRSGLVYLLSTEEVLHIENVWLHLSHYPLAEWDRKHYGAWHLHSHSHGRHEGKGKILDVGVDNVYKIWGSFRPVSLEEISEWMKSR